MYIEFQELNISCFKTMIDVKLSLNEKGVFLVKGFNKDKGGSNGAGKTTIIDALLWCLFARTSSGEKGDEIINRGKKGDTFVSCTFKRGEEIFKVTRYRGHSKFTNCVHLENITTGASEDLSGLTARDGTNEKVENLVGATYLQFINANVFCSSEDKVPFLKMTDRERKDSLIPPNILTKFKKASLKAGDLLKAIGDSSSRLRTNIELIRKDIENRENEKNMFRSRQDESELSRKSINQELITLGETGHTVKERLNDSKISLAKLNEERVVILKQLEDIESKNTSNNVLLSEIDRLNYKFSEVKAQIVKQCNNKENMRLQSEQNAILTEEHTTKIAREQIEAVECQQRLDDNKIAAKLVAEEYKEFVPLSQVDSEIIRIGNTIYTYTLSRSAIEAQIGKLESLVNGLDTYFSEKCKSCAHNKVSNMYDDYNKQIDTLTTQLGELNTSCDTTENTLKAYEENRTKILTINTKCDKLKVDEANISNSLKVITSSIKDSERTLNQLSGYSQYFDDIDADIQKLRDNKSEIIKELSEIDEKRKSIKDTSKEQELADKDMADIDKVISELGYEEVRLSSELKGLRDKYSDKKDELRDIKDYYENIQKADDAIKVFAGDIENLTKEAIGLEGKQNFIEFWKEGFSSTGIESFMIDDTVARINERIVVYMDILSGGTMDVNLKATRDLKSGKTVNKTEVTIDNRFGSSSYAGSSAGERQLMNIAALLARKDITQCTTGHSWNILFMDEIFTNLDANSCSLVISVIKQLKSASSIYTVSHRETVYLDFDAYIAVEKKNGVTSIKEIVS